MTATDLYVSATATNANQEHIVESVNNEVYYSICRLDAIQTDDTDSASLESAKMSIDIFSRLYRTPSRSKSCVEEFNMNQLLGKFDLFSMENRELSRAYYGPESVEPEKLFRKLKVSQRDYQIARVFLSVNREGKITGTFAPMTGCKPIYSAKSPDLNINIVDVTKVDKVHIGQRYRLPNGHLHPVTGVEARLVSRSELSPGIRFPEGMFNMRPIWKKVTNSGTVIELFDGVFSYEPPYKTKSTQDGRPSDIQFWAIRNYL